MSFPHQEIFLVLFLASNLVTTIKGQLPITKIPNCPSFDCGDNVPIPYPFWVSQPGSSSNSKFCGYPELEITCLSNTATFKALSDNYTVTNITVETKIFSLFDTDVKTSTCPKVRHQVDLSAYPNVTYTPQVLNLTFFFNCTPRETSQLSFSNMTLLACLRDIAGPSYVFAGEVPPDTGEILSANCSGGRVVSPVLNTSIAADPTNLAQSFGDVLSKGFELQWKEPRMSNCLSCERTDGYCGHQNTSGYGLDFICFCKDGTQRTYDCSSTGSNTSKKFVMIGAASLLGLVNFVGSGSIWCRRRKKHAESHKQRKEQEQVLFPRNESSGPLTSTESFFMDIATLQAATENFSNENKLGEGGFGPVYRGMLPDGKQIAVKRLSSTSTQGFLEFKNEVKSIAKLQHRNLVRLLGCCIDRNEKLLVYEYLPNQSLNTFIFDSERRSLLDWSKRLHIITGITRGLIYLHEDSRLKIVHRDLKPGNILLDHEMNPKISDFGLARIFSNDENEANTNRVVGTYGYMAPEFAMDGMFSVKSDVYSFGILLLEIISGNKNGRSHFLHFETSLPDHAWELWEQGKGVELIDTLMLFSCPVSEILRCIHIALLCVQENAMDRPSISMVLHMLQTEQMVLKEPKKPPSFIRSVRERSTSSCSSKIPSNNKLTLSSVPGR